MLKNITTPLAVAAVNALALPATATTAHAATGCGTGPATHSSTRTRAPATPSPLEAQGGLRVDFAAWKGGQRGVHVSAHHRRRHRSVTDVNYGDTAVAPGKSKYYMLSAVDAAGNESELVGWITRGTRPAQ
jgi:hypothetical protein